MVNDRRNNEDGTPVINFGFLIQQFREPEGIAYRMLVENQGISDAEIIARMEAWLYTFRKRFRDQATLGMAF